MLFRLHLDPSAPSICPSIYQSVCQVCPQGWDCLRIDNISFTPSLRSPPWATGVNDGRLRSLLRNISVAPGQSRASWPMGRRQGIVWPISAERFSPAADGGGHEQRIIKVTNRRVCRHLSTRWLGAPAPDWFRARILASPLVDQPNSISKDKKVDRVGTGLRSIRSFR